MKNYFVVRVKENQLDFAEKNRVAIGWSDWKLSEYQTDIDNLMEIIDVHHKSLNVSATRAGIDKGQIKRFLSIRKGDVVIVPCYQSFMIGTATGHFIYDIAWRASDLANQLEVEFERDLDGKIILFSREGKNTALVSKLRVPGFAVLSLTEIKSIEAIEELREKKKDYSQTSYVRNLEIENLENFKKELIEALQDYKSISFKAGGRGFEELIRDLLINEGFEAQILAKNAGQEGADADIWAYKSSNLGPAFDLGYLIQAKHHVDVTSSGLDQIVKFKEQVEKTGKLPSGCPDIDINNIRYILITSARFSKEITEKAMEEKVTLIEGAQLAEMLFDKLDDMPDHRYRLGFIKGIKRAE